MKRYCAYIPLILIVLLTSCGGGGHNEGVLKFEITYLESEKKEMPIIGLLPTEMEQTFKNGSSKSEIKGFMGMFLSAYVSNNEDKTNSILFAVMSAKHFCKTKFGEPTLGFDAMPGMHIEITKEKKEIAEMKAIKANVTFDDPNIPPYEIWFTNDIKIDNPNWHTPYREINGVLLQYKVKMKGITMILKAKELKQVEVDPKVFNVPDGFKKVSPEELSTIVDEMMKSAK